MITDAAARDPQNGRTNTDEIEIGRHHCGEPKYLECLFLTPIQ